jgi:hypothetical protein
MTTPIPTEITTASDMSLRASILVKKLATVIRIGMRIARNSARVGAKLGYNDPASRLKESAMRVVKRVLIAALILSISSESYAMGAGGGGAGGGGGGTAGQGGTGTGTPNGDGSAGAMPGASGSGTTDKSPGMSKQKMHKKGATDSAASSGAM